MQVRVKDLCYRDVINIKDGCRLGCVNDIELDTCTARVLCIVIFGNLKFFGLFGREDDIIIPWENIEIIGEDTILVNFCQKQPRKKKTFFENLQ
ncbi:MAG: YlmC/YmxH family sporulation protein [Hydrogenoanaerobacterium sp.]